MGAIPVMSDKIESLCPGSLRPYPRNARTHSKKQIRQIADLIQRFGFTNPVLIDQDNTILAGHGRVAAAQLLGTPRVALYSHRDDERDREAGLCHRGQ